MKNQTWSLRGHKSRECLKLWWRLEIRFACPPRWLCSASPRWQFERAWKKRFSRPKRAKYLSGECLGPSRDIESQSRPSRMTFRFQQGLGREWNTYAFPPSGWRVRSSLSKFPLIFPKWEIGVGETNEDTKPAVAWFFHSGIFVPDSECPSRLCPVGGWRICGWVGKTSSSGRRN